MIGTGYTGDVAIDDLQLTTGDCLPSDVCDFEVDFCSWVNVGGEFNLKHLV